MLPKPRLAMSAAVPKRSVPPVLGWAAPAAGVVAPAPVGVDAAAAGLGPRRPT